MNASCEISSHCFAPDVPCHLGYDSHYKCPHWKGTASPAAGDTTGKAEADSYQPRWTGRAMGLVDMVTLTARGSPMVVGVLGAEGAGKTTLLTALYLMLTAGQKLPGFEFAGSYTLGGWELLASYGRHTASHPASFPLHTTTGKDRIPSLLHLSLRDHENRLHDLFFTDAPGEWFSRWAVAADAPDAEGARWVASHADAFLVLADSQALAGEGRGAASGDLQDLAQRLASINDVRPVTFLWSKSDLEIPSQIRNRVDRVRRACLPNAAVESVSVKNAAGLSSLRRLVAVVVESILKSRRGGKIEPPLRISSDPFIGFRGAV